MVAGAGNCPLEAFVAVANLMEWKHGCDVFAVMDAADDIVRPLQLTPKIVGRDRPAMPSKVVLVGVVTSIEIEAKHLGKIGNVQLVFEAKTNGDALMPWADALAASPGFSPPVRSWPPRGTAPCSR